MKHLKTYEKFAIKSFKDENNNEIYILFDKIIKDIKNDWTKEKLDDAYERMNQNWEYCKLKFKEKDYNFLYDDNNNKYQLLTIDDIVHFIESTIKSDNSYVKIWIYIKTWIQQYVNSILLNKKGDFYDWTNGSEYKSLIEGLKLGLI